MAEAHAVARPRKRWYGILYVQVLIAIALGILIGHFYPGTGKALKPLGDGFISLIKMMIAPVIFCTVVHGETAHLSRRVKRQPERQEKPKSSKRRQSSGIQEGKPCDRRPCCRPLPQLRRSR